MSPVKTVIHQRGICTTRESETGLSFTLKPSEITELLNISKSTLFHHEDHLQLHPRRSFTSQTREYNDAELLALARFARGVNIAETEENIQITSSLGNTAILPKGR